LVPKPKGEVGLIARVKWMELIIRNFGGKKEGWGYPKNRPTGIMVEAFL